MIIEHQTPFGVNDMSPSEPWENKTRNLICPRLLICAESREDPICPCSLFVTQAAHACPQWDGLTLGLFTPLAQGTPNFSEHSLTLGSSCQIQTTLALQGLRLHLLPVSCPPFSKETGADSQVKKYALGSSSDPSPTPFHHPNHTQFAKQCDMLFYPLWAFAHTVPSA